MNNVEVFKSAVNTLKAGWWELFKARMLRYGIELTYEGYYYLWVSYKNKEYLLEYRKVEND